MNFSRRNAIQPLPPAPLAQYTFATSRNFMTHFHGRAAGRKTGRPLFLAALHDLGNIEKLHVLRPFQAALFKRKAFRVNSISWHSTLAPRAMQSRIRLPLWRAPSFISTLPEAGLS